MKKYYIAALVTLCGFSVATAQKTIDYSIRVSASMQKSPPQITLSWPSDKNITNCLIYRKLKGDATFGAVRATLTKNDSVYIDKTVSVGVNYEYELVKIITGSTYYGFGYISTGIELPMTEDRGKLLLVYDKALLPALKPEIDRLIADMAQDGWAVVTHGVNKTDKVTDVHNLIKGDYNVDKSVKAVFLLGHVPVPYSGGSLGYGLNPVDGHDFRQNQHPSHNGAWPADVYYADMNGTWTDTDVFDTLGSYTANHNVDGDGKFDQDVLPAKAVLQVGRVDMFDMPAFAPMTETDLLKRYLNKDHKWRTGQIAMREKGFVSDAIGTLGGEAPAACGYKNFAPMFGSANVDDAGSWETVLSKNSYLWSCSVGYGSFTNESGISSTSNYATDSLQTVFTSAFGSWFGDWNVTNNYLRAPLASKGPILTNVYSGRPQWQFHHMAMGDNIGYSALLNFNEYANGTKDYSNYFRSQIFGSADRMTHVALLGDPTLRMHVVQPPGTLTLTHTKLVVDLTWAPSPDAGILGYYIYRAPALDQPFVRMNATPVTVTTYRDNSALHHINYYMVRAVKLQTSASGSYFNLSQGSMDTLTTDNSAIADNSPAIHSISVFPNPGNNLFHIPWPGSEQNMGLVQVYDVLGKEVYSKTISGMTNLQTIDIDLAKSAKGVYMLRLTNGNDTYLQRVVKE
jgi:hypothetical protein